MVDSTIRKATGSPVLESKLVKTSTGEQAVPSSSTRPSSAVLTSTNSACLLVVDQQPKVHQFMCQSLAGSNLKVLHAKNIYEAKRLIDTGCVDLLLIESHLPDGSGIELAGELQHKKTAIETLITTDTPNVDDAIQAMRAGVCDYLPKPVEAGDIRNRLHHAAAKHQAKLDDDRRLKRLKQTCRKLNAMRKTVTQQVDILCSDLVTAYQELAGQMHHVAQASEFGALLREELDLEQVLRKTLEFLLDKAGSTNAVIFLPSEADEYSTAGYINYDCSGDSADMLLDHLADVVAPKLAGTTEMVHVKDHEKLEQWIGDDAAYLVDYELLGFAAEHEEETLATVLLFRDKREPFDHAATAACQAIAPMLGEYLAKLIRIHHRCIEQDEPEWPGYEA